LLIWMAWIRLWGCIKMHSRLENSYIKILKDLIKIPSISFDGFDNNNVKRCANAVFNLFRAHKFDKVRFLGEKTGKPAVFAQLNGNPKLPSVLLYAHYDVQPAAPDAFNPYIKNGRLYGRGSADDKAAVILHLTAALIAKTALGNDCPTIKILIEGEEECGSPNLSTLLKECKELKSDVAIVCDSSNWDETTPAIVNSLRGVLSLEVELKSMAKPLHSGLWSGPIPDVAQGLAHILTKLELPKHSAKAQMPYSAKRLRQECELLGKTQILVKESEILTSLWKQPSITVTAIEAGNRKLAGNVLQNTAWARISIRIPPGMDVKKVLSTIKKNIEASCPWGLTLSIKTEKGISEPWETKTDNKFFKKMLVALQKGYGKKAVVMGCGASIPMVAALSKAFKGMPVLLTGVEDPKSNAHGENESVSLDVLSKAIVSEALFFATLGEK